MKKIFFLALTFLGLFSAGAARAVCPICIVAVGAGLGMSRWLGVDDTISSIWIGALLVAISIWTIIWLKKKNWNFKYSSITVFAVYYLLTLVPLFYADIVGHPLNKIFGIDKIVFGTILGTAVFLLVHWLHKYLKHKNGDKSFFPYQKVVFPVVALLLASTIFFILLKYSVI